MRKKLLQAVLFCAGAALLARAFSGVDFRATLHTLASAGPAALVVLVPFGVGLLLDTSAVLAIARAASLELRATEALLVRVVSEALHFGAPGGVVASEAASIALYTKRCGLEAHESAVVAARRKQLVMRAHAAYLALAAIVGASALSRIGVRPALVLASAALPLATSFVVTRAMHTKWLASARSCFDRVTRARQATALATLVFFAAWLVEATETAVVLRVIGIRLPVPAILAVEGAISLARSAVAFVPGGLGVQDLGYTVAFRALGVTPEAAAAFALLKRAKELVWIVIGFVVSASMRNRRTTLLLRSSWASGSDPSSGASRG